MVTRRSGVVAVILLSCALGSVAACRACDESAPSSPDVSADASAPPDAARDAAPPYLPARPLPNDSPAPLSVVESALTALRPQLNACYRTAAKDHPKLEGQAMLEVTIGGDGHATNVTTISQTGLDATMLACLTSAMRSVVFPPPADGGPVVIKVPLSFRPPPPRPDAGR